MSIWHDETRTPDEEYADAGECALYLSERFNMDAKALLSEPEALVECVARWHIRGDADPEALAWLTELVGWQRISSDRVSRMAARIVNTELLPCVEALVSSSSIPTLPA